MAKQPGAPRRWIRWGRRYIREPNRCKICGAVFYHGRCVGCGDSEEAQSARVPLSRYQSDESSRILKGEDPRRLLTEQGALWPWTEHPGLSSKKEFAAEISDFGDAVRQGTSFNIKLPNGEMADLREFESHRDREGDTTHWTLSRGGMLYIVFND